MKLLSTFSFPENILDLVCWIWAVCVMEERGADTITGDEEV